MTSFIKFFTKFKKTLGWQLLALGEVLTSKFFVSFQFNIKQKVGLHQNQISENKASY